MIGKLLQWILPKRCLKCGTIVEEGAGEMCGPCWSTLTFLNDPQCARCGYPFDVGLGEDMGSDLVCAPCLQEAPPYNQARAALIYDDHSKPMILKFKHGDGTHQAPAFAHWIHRAGEPLLKDDKILAPIPLHWFRLFKRRYNQAGLLAQALQKETGLPLILDLLKRTRHTSSQGYLTSEERAKNVKNAFEVKKKYLDQIKNKDIILVDDVLTSGATVEECTRVLRKAGAKQINVLTLARVVRPEHITLKQQKRTG